MPCNTAATAVDLLSPTCSGPALTSGNIISSATADPIRLVQEELSVAERRFGVETSRLLLIAEVSVDSRSNQRLQRLELAVIGGL